MSDARAPNVYTPATLAQEWGVSDHHVRNLIATGQLQAFKVGGKLLRIRPEVVREFECRNTTSADCAESSSSSITTSEENDTVTRLEPQTRARLNALRHRSTTS